MRMSPEDRVQIGPAVSMPRLGFGTYKALPGEVEHAVEFALRQGYRSIDTASLYGNEEGIAAGISASGVPREEIFIASKVWNAEQGYESTLEALNRTLARLETSYVDLYLVHWPIEAHMAATWRAMERLLEEGLTRAIGVCNHLEIHLDRLLQTATIPPAIDQIEFHPLLQQPTLQAYLAAHGIALEAWAPLMKGRVGEIAELREIGARHDVSPAQVSIRWILQLGHITIPKSVHDERIAENFDIFDFALDEDEMNTIRSLDRGQRFGPDPMHYAW